MRKSIIIPIPLLVHYLHRRYLDIETTVSRNLRQVPVKRDRRHSETEDRSTLITRPLPLSTGYGVTEVKAVT